MKQYDTIALILFVIGCIVFIAIWYSRKQIVKRKLNETKEKPIEQCFEGDVVRLKGRIVRGDKLLIAPLTRKKCVYYHVVVNREILDEDLTTDSYTIIDEEEIVDFKLNNGKSFTWIDTSFSKTYSIKETTFTSGTFNDATPNLEKYLNMHNVESENFLGTNKSLVYTEMRLEETQEIVVCGKLEKIPEINVSNDILFTLTHESKNEELYITDDFSLLTE